MGNKLDTLIMDAEIACGATGFSTIAELAPLVSLFGEGVRQLTIANEIAVLRHQVEYASAQQKNPDIVYEVDPPIDLSKPKPAPDALVEAIKKIPLGRLLCNQCDSWDHECGCSPDIIERTRQEFLADHEKEKSHDR